MPNPSDPLQPSNPPVPQKLVLTKQDELNKVALTAIQQLEKNSLVLEEVFGYQAKLLKLKYDALIERGFTDPQAVHLCTCKWD